MEEMNTREKEEEEYDMRDLNLNYGKEETSGRLILLLTKR